MTEAEQTTPDFSCERCGAALAYDPDGGALRCGHCGHVQEIEAVEGPWGGATVAEMDFEQALRNAKAGAQTEEIRVIKCDACGASTEFGPEVDADRCPFCASPLVAGPSAQRRFKPTGLLPFLTPETDARDALKRWIDGLWFAPSDLSDFARAGRALAGVYLPYWTFDADTRSRYSGERGDVYYVQQWVTVRRNGKSVRQRKRVQKIRWTRVSGRVSRFFDDLLVCASRSLPARFVSRLGTGAWDLRGLEPYRPDFLAGFRAEAYAIEIEEGFGAARAEMDAVIRQDARRDIGGDRQRVRSVETQVSDVTFKHVLLPVWIAAYRYGGKSYRAVVNGRTGEVIGERPYSAWKIAIAALIGLGVAAAAAALYAVYGDGF